MAKSAYYEPGTNGVERLPTAMTMFHASPLLMRSPHWHAQVEVNFIVRGWAHYKMSGHEVKFRQGELAMFWGGLPHYLDDASEDLIYAGGHLPLVHFFRLRLPTDVQSRLMQGATLVTSDTDAADPVNFARWNQYARSGDPMRAGVAVNELLLRIERIRFGAYSLLSGDSASSGAPGMDHQTSPIVVRICDYIADNFREDIDSADIACAADIHPKYAMNVFKKSTGMTINEYVNLLRLSYAQALLMLDDANVLHVAMESGFGSLSAFNKSFRKIAGMSPSDFRRDVRGHPSMTGNERAPRELSHQ
ncbi:AraC family transcriptional regulator [Devosia limi DSM 17137]|uniref:AraC family transcriptional regulator n=1 Tax=Devosia limi DSM 17137 TaxID=1121477 RepID=A0A0F5LVL6_9HYPH|nr:helix-turn-helix domain-containing protein [Devosia limi]KKB86331.1 AraC family transcriptional regulator [Devosia limi DSM 17137]SHF75447.1 AraC-type DNA-binding protein [Devosia limi DSM 17137]